VAPAPRIIAAGHLDRLGDRQPAPADAEVDEFLTRLSEQQKTYEKVERAAEKGDRVTIDFVGKIDGEAFEGGSAEAAPIVLGESSFIPGFEDGLMGVKAGDERAVSATFPADYPVETLAGKDAVFDVKVKEVATATRPAVDDEFAKSLGTETVDQLKELVNAQIAREYANVSRSKLKRQLLDVLEKGHAFDLPPSLVDSEFAGIWQQLEGNLKQAGKTFADEGKSEEEVREEYRRIAERRVRLGLVIGEIADKNQLKITQDEMRRALMEQARRFPGQEKAVYEYYEKNPAAVAELRAPLFEDKVVDFILEKATPTEKTVSKDELFAKPEEAGEA